MAFVNTLATSETISSSKQEEQSPNSVPVLHKSYKPYYCGDKWWKKTVIYEVYVRSFYDSNNDGIGDLKGIEEKLDYFKYLGVDTLWITPMYPSPMIDFGYDISDFKGIDTIFGTMKDFKELLRSMKDKEMKLILDFVPNHTSDQHEWFKKSVQRQDPFTEYYVWKRPKEFDSNSQPLPPNNWVSVFGGSAWKYNETRGEFYLHQFAVEQPDLNFRNPLVIHEMIDVMRFWLEIGVDGFRLDAVPHLLEDEEFRDNPETALSEEMKKIYTVDDYCYWDHKYTCDCPGVLEILETFRKVSEECTLKDGCERLFVTEGYLPLPELMRYYGSRDSPIADFSFNFELLGLKKDCSATNVFESITKWLDALPEGCWPNWQTGNHDQPRIASKLGSDMIDIINMIMLILPGTAITYYGEEIGMENTEVSWEQTQDPAGKNAGEKKFHLFSRDPERAPLQWSSSGPTAGFSKSTKPWLPIKNNFPQVNVKTQMEADKSHLKTYKKLVSLRSTTAWQKGNLDIRVASDGAVLAISRCDTASGESLLMFANFSRHATQIAISEFEHIPPESSITVVASCNQQETWTDGSTITVPEIQISGRSGLVCRAVRK